jgi:hypothetical protein
MPPQPVTGTKGDKVSKNRRREAGRIRVADEALDKQVEERLKHRYHEPGAEHSGAEIRQFEQGFPLFVVEQSNNLTHDRSPLAHNGE